MEFLRVMKNNLIYKWIYVLALPDEAKNYVVKSHLVLKCLFGVFNS